MSRRPWNLDYWTAELEYFHDQATRPWHGRMKEFKGYAAMQAAFATRDGFPEIGKQIAEIAGIDPNCEEN
jgi:hypothetical protein